MSAVPEWLFDTVRDDAADFSAAPRRERISRAAVDEARAEPDDVALLVRLQADDEQALELIFDRYLTPLVRFADTILHGDQGLAGDVVSDVLTTLWMRRADAEPIRNLRSYLYRAVRNHALSQRRSDRRAAARVLAFGAEARSVGLGEPAASPDTAVEADERIRIVWQSVRAMREPLRTVAILRWSHGLSFAEVGQVVGCSEAVARTHASRALTILRAIVPDLIG
jgi:RNA polymerase sigma factor (sigma-70 family)